MYLTSVYLCSGCCCGGEDVEAPFEQSVSERVSQTSTSKAAQSSRKTHICESCGPVLRYILQLAGHQGTPHSQKAFECGVLMKQFYFSAHLQRHQKQHLGEKPFKSSIDRTLFVKNCKSHVSEKPLTCDEVGKNFPATSEHLQQQTAHTGEEPDKITQCWATIQNRKSPFTWGECKKAFSPLHTHIQDQGVHAGRQCFVCSECGKTFKYKSSLVVHQRVHTGERLHVCGDCGKSFRRTSVLNQHRRIDYWLFR